MNKPMFSSFAATGSPAKIACNALRGILVAITTKTTPRLKRKPVVIIVEEIPAAMPLRAAGEAFITEATLGATNIPEPTPTKIIGGAIML
jgi:hypothetical protein